VAVLLSPPSPSVPLKGTGGPMPVYVMSAREALREDGRGCEVLRGGAGRLLLLGLKRTEVRIRSGE
jgi:hypothetical protein